MTQETIVNRVAKSPLVTLDLENYFQEGERVLFDMKDYLFNELILKEKDFRRLVSEHDWAQYKNKNVAIHCSVDAIVPTWAYMLVTSNLTPYANMVVFGNLNSLEEALIRDAFSRIDLTQYENAKVVIKGCSKLSNPAYAFTEVTRLLQPHVSSLMYGEPCSTVPIFKKKKS